MRWVLRSLLALLGLVAGVALTVLIADQVTAPRKADLTPLIEKARAYDVVIRRDRFGVPHILGKTDADAAFGLAFAHAEDDFETSRPWPWPPVEPWPPARAPRPRRATTSSSCWASGTPSMPDTTATCRRT